MGSYFQTVKMITSNKEYNLYRQLPTSRYFPTINKNPYIFPYSSQEKEKAENDLLENTSEKKFPDNIGSKPIKLQELISNNSAEESKLVFVSNFKFELHPEEKL